MEKWYTRSINSKYPYLYVDGIYLKRNWGGEVRNVSVLVAINVNEDCHHEILGAAEGLREDYESWKSFFVWLKQRGLKGVQLVIGDKCLGMLESALVRCFLTPDTRVAPFISNATCFPSRLAGR